MSDIRLPLEQFTQVKTMPPLLTSELQALYLLRPQANTERLLVIRLYSHSYLYIKRLFRSGRHSEAFVRLDPELVDTLRLLTMSENGVPTERSLSSVGATRYEGLVYNLSQEIAIPALRSAGIRGQFGRPETVLEASVAALALPHQQVIYLQAPTQLRMTDLRDRVFYVRLTGEVMNLPEAIRS